MPSPETAAHAACRRALERYVSSDISASDATDILVANGAPNDPDGTGEAYSAQQALANLNQRSASISEALTALGV